MKRQYCYIEKREGIVPDDYQCHPICDELQKLTIAWNNLVESHFTHIRCNCETLFSEMAERKNVLLAKCSSS